MGGVRPSAYAMAQVFKYQTFRVTLNSRVSWKGVHPGRTKSTIIYLNSAGHSGRSSGYLTYRAIQPPHIHSPSS